MTSKVLLKYLDSPVRILSLSLNDLIAYLTPFFIGSFLDSLIIIPFCGLLMIYIAKRLLKKFPRFYLKRYLYWALPTSKYNNMARISWPSSSKRRWVK